MPSTWNSLRVRVTGLPATVTVWRSRSTATSSTTTMSPVAEPRAGPAAPVDRVHPGQELADVVGLDEVVVGAGVQAEDPVVDLAARRHDDHRHLADLADRPADVHAVDVGQAEVEQHDVHAAEVVDRPAAPGQPRGRDAVAVQRRAERSRDPVVVLHEQDVHPRTPVPKSVTGAQPYG